MKKVFYLIAVFLLALTSCVQENLECTSVSIGKIQVSFEGGWASRMAVGEQNVLTWSSGDAITMFNSDGESSKWTLEGEGGKPDGTFSGFLLDGTLKGAAFPASATPVLTNGYELTMTLPATLTYEEGICNLPMWASFSSLDDNISFKHLGAMLKIDFTDLPEDYSSLTVTANKAIAGVFTANISNEEPVLSLKENGSKSVTITFDAISGEDNDRLFYLPLPVGVYGSINVSVSDGENSISIVDWKDCNIKRRTVYRASLTHRELSGEVTSEIVTQTLSEMAAVTSNATLDIVDEFKADNGAITIPAELSNVNINFAETPQTFESTPLKIEEDTDASNGAQLTVSLPVGTTESYLEVNTPTTTVNIEGGTYKRIVATTADNTLVLGDGSVVFDLVVVAGNISFKGGKVTGTITRHDSNTDEVTYIYVDSFRDLLDVVLGNKIEVVMPDYVTFTAESEQTFSLTKEVETLEYSVNGGKWTELGTKTVTFGGETGELRLRGKSSYGTATSTQYGQNSKVQFGNDVKVSCTGDIRTLIDYENYTTTNTSNARFCYLFDHCFVLTKAPKLPATTLADCCYFGMFGCCGITEAPVLPATKLADECYVGMFGWCSFLTKAPELPAKILAPECYRSMFHGCESLSEAPELPATTLAKKCYNLMFCGCALTKAPALPATTLAERCYWDMFYYCQSLVEVPELPATTLAASCYSSMFSGCSSLTEAPELPATALAEKCYSSMFSGCTSLTKAPVLPATILASYCYWGMFSGCTNLIKAPELSATNLDSYCYQYMFKGCEKLQEIKMLATNISAYSCLNDWLDGVSLTGTFIKAPEMTTLPSGSSGIPLNWTVIDNDKTGSNVENPVEGEEVEW